MKQRAIERPRAIQRQRERYEEQYRDREKDMKSNRETERGTKKEGEGDRGRAAVYHKDHNTMSRRVSSPGKPGIQRVQAPLLKNDPSLPIKYLKIGDQTNTRGVNGVENRNE